MKMIKKGKQRIEKMSNSKSRRLKILQERIKERTSDKVR
jgi:hypothetical protein